MWHSLVGAKLLWLPRREGVYDPGDSLAGNVLRAACQRWVRQEAKSSETLGAMGSFEQ